MDFSDPQKAFEGITHLATLNAPRENWIILYQGKPMGLVNNGKFRWSKPQHALSALTNAWETTMRYNHAPYSSKSIPYELQQRWLEAFKEWRKTNIEIVRQEDYEAKCNTKSG